MPAPDSSSIVAIRLELRDGLAQITIDRPPLNVLDTDALRQLNQALATCASDEVRVVLLRSGVPRAFSAGVEIGDHTAARLPAMLDQVREQARRLLALNALTIAVIHGATLGGGAELALLCDQVIAADDTTLGFPEIRLAAFPPIAAALLPERYPWPVAMRLMLGESIGAATAERLGLVSTVVPRAQLDAAAAEQASAIAAGSGAALKALIAATRGQRAGAILERLDAAIETYRSVIAPSRDAQEGIDAFLQKRSPAWSHR
ncbi:MAG TPA: enoyl-CoA hydratase/isomerase family protein [Candidatus Dormibacteraeota bacterium]|nr:enoyl-CoA hydratase/isomerase family protein [Candidatus Dormibacteraeota bacterium]